MAERLEEAGLELSDHQLQQLWAFHTMLRRENAELNLTRIHNFDRMVRKHYVDSMLPATILEKHGIKLPRQILDMGTGPGFPGIPLAIFRPDVNWILADGRAMRTDFVARALKNAGLANAEAHTGQIGSESDLGVGAVITRAVETMSRTADRVAHLLKEGGLLIFMKGPGCEPELAEMLADRAGSYQLVLDHAYRLPRSRDERRLVVFARSASARVGATPDDVIRSPDNARFKQLRSMRQSRPARKLGQTLVHGEKLVREVLRDETAQAIALVCSESHPPSAQGGGPPIWRFADELFREIDSLNTGRPLLLIRVPELSPYDPTDQAGLTVFLPLQDPENLGAALRSVAAFSPARTVLLAESAWPFHPRCLRASGGQALRLSLLRGPSIHELVSRAPLYALSASGVPLSEHQLPADLALLVGEEGPGLPAGLDAKLIRIVTSESVESLNASVALGIALYEISRRRN